MLVRPRNGLRTLSIQTTGGVRCVPILVRPINEVYIRSSRPDYDVVLAHISYFFGIAGIAVF